LRFEDFFITKRRRALGKDEIDSEIYVPRKAFLVYGIFLFISLLVGLFILSNFTLQHKPVSPAALTQLHTHTGIFSVGFMMVMLAMSALGVNIEKLNFFFKLGTLSLAGTVIGLLIFILFKTHSILWVIPSGLYFIFLILGWLSLFGKFGLKVPSINSIGRIGAWFDLPGGAGPLFLVAQPLKTLNILSLIAITILFLSIKSKNK
jgi:hypothetical protein